MQEDVGSLLTFAELAVAFAGFASVVVLFQHRTGGAWAPLDAIRFRLMVQLSLFAALFSVLPLPVHKLGASADLAWSLSSGVLAVYLGLGTVFQFRSRRLFSGAIEMIRWGAFQLLFQAALIAQLLNAFGVVFHRESGPYIFGVALLLFWAGWQFYQLVVPARSPSA